MTNARLKKIVAVFFFTAVFLYYLMPIWDVDFPWHLRTGQYIVQFHQIPKADPFSDASNGSMTERFILSQYWLAQVFFYLLFANIGPLGIVVLRSLILTGIIVILWRSMKETPLVLKVLILYYMTTLFVAFSGERPQLFSFLFSLLTVALLESYRKNHSIRPLLLLLLLMLIWANMHGGFIMGDVIILIVCLSESLKFFLLRGRVQTLPAKPLLLLVLAGFFSIAASYVNPNGYYAFVFVLNSSSAYSNTIREYIAPLAETWGTFVNRNDFIYWSIMGYCLVLLALNFRRVDLTHLALIFFTLVVSLTAVRFVPFFLTTSLFISGSYGFGAGHLPRLRSLRKLLVPLNLALLALVVLWCGERAYHLPPKESLTKMGRSVLYCEDAVRFLRKNIHGGRLFNSHSSGGYLILRLYPAFQTFIDTRAYNIRNVIEADTISYALRWEGDRYSLWDAISELLPKKYGKITVEMGKRPRHPPGKEKWLELLDKYKIDVIIHEACNLFSGELFPLPLRLMTRKEWKLVYIDGRVLIFVRDVPKFRELISKYGLDKTKVYDEIGMESARTVGGIHAETYACMAFALLMKGAPENVVRQYIKQALYLDSKDLLASYLEAFLALKKGKE